MVDNLVNNASQVHPGLRAGDGAAARTAATAVVLEVIDSGEGIDPDEIDNIFKRFYRSGRVVRRAVPAHGLA